MSAPANKRTTNETRQIIKAIEKGKIFTLDGKQYVKLDGAEFKPLESDVPRSIVRQPGLTDPSKLGSSPVEQPVDQRYETKRLAAAATAVEREKSLPVRGASQQPAALTDLADDVRTPADLQSPDRHAKVLSPATGAATASTPLTQTSHGGSLPYNPLTTTRRPSFRHESGPIPSIAKEARPSARTQATRATREPATEQRTHRDSSHDVTSKQEVRRSGTGDKDKDNDDDVLNDFEYLEGISKHFANIPQKDFKQRSRFLCDNIELLDAKLEEYLKEAVHQLLQHKLSASIQCVESLVILNLCKKSRARHLESKILAMSQQGTQEHEAFETMYKDVCDQAQDLAKLESQRRHVKAVPRLSARPSSSAINSRIPGADMEDATVNPRHAKYGTQFDPHSAIDHPREDEQNVPQTQKAKTPLDRLSRADLTPVSTQQMKKVEPEQFTGEMKTLYATYQMPKQGARFFAAGRVFSLLWHEPAGTPRAPASEERDKAGVGDRLGPNKTIGPYGEVIYSHIRRMVVIRNREGYCWCLGINSYNGQGLNKAGLKAQERDAHTIIHDANLKPTPLDGEPKPRKRPIPVVMVKGQTLTRASRLHYGKPYVVEWNTRVMNVGTVHPDHLPVLIAEADTELLGDARKLQQTQ